MTPSSATGSISQKVFKGYGIEVRPVIPEDLPSLRRWRNSPKIAREMRDQSYISSHRQRVWYEHICDRRDEAHWTVWCKDVRTGYLNVKGNGPLEEQSEVDVGMYAGDSPVRHGLLGLSMAMIQLEIVFDALSVSRVRMFVKETNSSALKFNGRLGYREDGHEEGFLWLTMTASEYSSVKPQLLRYFRNNT